MVQKKIRRKCSINNSHWNELRIIFKKKEEKNVLFGPFDVSYTLYANRQPSHHSPLKWKCSFGCHQINQSALWSRKKERERRREKHPIPDEMKNKLYESESICWECVCVCVVNWEEQSRARWRWCLMVLDIFHRRSIRPKIVCNTVTWSNEVAMKKRIYAMATEWRGTGSYTTTSNQTHTHTPKSTSKMINLCNELWKCSPFEWKYINV